MRILAVADDLTGALETGAKFAGYGFRAAVTLWPRTGGDDSCEVLVVDAESRHLPAAEAAERVGRLAAEALASGADLFFHKVDSTLRGNIGAEINAVAGAFRGRGVEYAPAYPALGRTVSGGRLFIHSIPAHETEFARDPRNPIRTNDVREVVGGHPAIVIHDGKTEEDVEAVARRVLHVSPAPAACGTAALAGHLAAQLRPETKPAARWPRVSHCIVVNGSLHPRSIEQIRQAPREWRTFSYESGIAETIAQQQPEALIVFGGDTTFEILRALEVTLLRPQGEILPGLPFSLMENGPRYLITKAGGFGTIDVLEQLRRKLA